MLSQSCNDYSVVISLKLVYAILLILLSLLFSKYNLNWYMNPGFLSLICLKVVQVDLTASVCLQNLLLHKLLLRFCFPRQSGFFNFILNADQV